MTTVFLFALIAASAGAAKEMAIASKFGVSADVDAYQFLFALSQWPLSILASIFTASLIPLIAQISTTSPTQLKIFRAEVLGLALLCTVPVCVLCYFVMQMIVGSSIISLTAEVQSIASAILFPMVVLIGFGIPAVLLGGWIMADNRHINTLLQAIPATCIVAVTLLSAGDIQSLAWGSALGFAAYAIASWLALNKPMSNSSLSFSFTSIYWKTLFWGMGTLLFGQILMSLVTLLDQFFAARLGVGALSILSYSNRIVALVLGLAAIAINRGMLPILSRVHAGTPLLVRRIASKFALIVFVLGILIAIVGAVLSDTLVSLIYERGAFEPEDTSSVALLVRFSMLQVPFFLTSLVFVSALLAQARFGVILVAAFVNGVVKVALAVLLIPIFGLPGLLLATAGVYLVSTIHCWSYLHFGRQPVPAVS